MDRAMAGPGSNQRPGEDDEALVVLDNAGLRKGGRWLVRGVDLSVPRGRIVTLIGPNGSGKSTTARLALGLSAPSEGKAWRARRLAIGYVPQRLEIDWTLPLSVRRFMALTRRLPRADVDGALERVGIGHLAGAQMRTLSGGEYQRALIARAIALKPDLLVLDEPVQGVDVKGESALYSLIDEIRTELGCGVLMISHDLHVVMASTDTVICLDGHVCCRGTPDAVSQSRAYHDLFGPRGAGGIALFRHDLHHHHHEHHDHDRHEDPRPGDAAREAERAESSDA